MRRIAKQFDALSSADRKCLITFITAGDPSVKETPGLMHTLVRGGADIIELGVPFSDPMADGAVIQRASERAVKAGVSLGDVLDCVTEFRRTDGETPVVLMGYLNPFEHIGAETFAKRAARAGVDGVLVVDMPPEEALEFHGHLESAGLDQIFLVAPNSQVERIRSICELASGFVYFVAVKGVTGDKEIDIDAINAKIADTSAMAGLPVGLGFGIKTPAAAAKASTVADAVIVGSAIVELIDKVGASVADLERFVNGFRQAIDTQTAA